MPNVHRLGFGFMESEKVLLRALERFVRALQSFRRPNKRPCTELDDNIGLYLQRKPGLRIAPT